MSNRYGCVFTDSQGVCAQREARCDIALRLCYVARMEVERLKKLAPADQADLFAPTVDPAQVEFWEGIWEAVALESRRMHRVFWRLCRHGEQESAA